MATQIDMLGAIELAMEAEERARCFYEEGGKKTEHPRGRELFGQLADFERSHYRHLRRLLDSLKTSGHYITYRGASFSKSETTWQGEKAGEPNAGQVLDILNMAIKAEDETQKRYAELAKQTGDVSGRKMFEQLSEEEKLHARILNDEFYNLSNQGAWSSRSLWSE